MLARVNNRREEYPTLYKASTNDSARFNGLSPDVLTCSHLQNKEMWWFHTGRWWLKQSSNLQYTAIYSENPFESS